MYVLDYAALRFSHLILHLYVEQLIEMFLLIFRSSNEELLTGCRYCHPLKEKSDFVQVFEVST